MAKELHEISTACNGVVIIILGLSGNYYEETRDKNRNLNQSMEYLRNQNNKLKLTNRKA